MRAGPAFAPLGAIAVMSVTIATFLAVTILVASAGAPGVVALVAGELMLVAIPLIARVRADLPLAALGLTRPPRRQLAAAALIGASAWYLNLRLASLLPLPKGEVVALDRMVVEPPLVVALLTIAVVPAICEEVLFRGVVLRALATRFIPVVAIASSAALFAAYHLSLVQLVPTFTLGLVLGLLALRAGSVVPAMVAHFLNNAIAVLVTRRALPGVSWMEHHPHATLAIATATTAAGVALALRGKAPA